GTLRTSLLQTGADAETRTIYPTDGSGNITSKRVKATIRHGWTKVLDSTGTPQLTERYIGTFYFTDHRCSGDMTADSHDRTLELHGPCLVDSRRDSMRRIVRRR